MASSEERLDEEKAVEHLNIALELQYRSALQYSIAAASLGGMGTIALGPQLTEFGDQELNGARLLIEKIVSFGGVPTTKVAELRHETDPKRTVAWLIECEQEGIEALQEAIEPTGREGRSEALEHMLEHQIMRKQRQVDLLARARDGG
jgi:bacterioferritin (cytochrome b1)